MAATQASFNYTRDDGVPPEIWFYDPPAGTALHAPGDDPRTMAVHDARAHAAPFALDREGFEIGDFDHAFDAWDDDAAIRWRCYDAVADYIRGRVGARRVVVFDHTLRSKVNEAQQTTEHHTTRRAPVMLVHCDYTPRSGPLRVRQLLGAEAEALLARRVAFYNFWMPLHRPVEEKPLAMCEVASSARADFLPMALRYRERSGEVYVLRHADGHRWWTFPRMVPGEALLLKTYESETDGRARFLGHSAFDDPATPPDAPTRESIEIRTMAFF